MSNAENASLVLKTADLPFNSTTSVGNTDQYLLNLTWSNINMRTVLGTMYDKYDTFNLCLSSVTTAVAGAGIGVNANDRIVVLNVGGLPFINNTYAAGLKHNTNTAVLGTFTFVPSQSVSQFFYSSNVATFGKNQDVCNISINYTRVSLNANNPPSYAVNTVNIYPDVCFIFDIFGIPKDNSLNGSRI